MLVKNKKEAIELVKNKLWSYGYKVKDYSNVKLIDFDLLLNKKIRLIVGRRKLDTIPAKCDIYIFVGRDAIFYEKKVNEKIIIKTSPYEIFGR